MHLQAVFGQGRFDRFAEPLDREAVLGAGRRVVSETAVADDQQAVEQSSGNTPDAITDRTSAPVRPTGVVPPRRETDAGVGDSGCVAITADSAVTVVPGYQ